jgi:hypothetical protein
VEVAEMGRFSLRHRRHPVAPAFADGAESVALIELGPHWGTASGLRALRIAQLS